MSAFQLIISTDNDAFGSEEIDGETVALDNRDLEVVRILRLTADRIANGESEGRVMDSNGNRVGYFTFNPAEEVTQ